MFATPQEDPWWRSAVPRLDHVPPPAGYADAWSFPAPVVEMPTYLSWLASRVAELGGTVTRLNLSSLPSGPDVVVNCAGIGSRLLASDLTVEPVRGQVVYVSQVGLEEWLLDSSSSLTYVVPRSHDIVLGGTDEEGDWSRTPSPETAAAILERARPWCRRWSRRRCFDTGSGFGPRGRRYGSSGSGSVVHCYGHGGAGVTLRWGTADEVAELVGPA